VLWCKGIEALILRTRGDQPTLWASVLPPELLRLPAELAQVDALLDDERFFAPLRVYSTAPSVARRSRWRPTCG